MPGQDFLASQGFAEFWLDFSCIFHIQEKCILTVSI